MIRRLLEAARQGVEDAVLAARVPTILAERDEAMAALGKVERYFAIGEEECEHLVLARDESGKYCALCVTELDAAEADARKAVRAALGMETP